MHLWKEEIIISNLEESNEDKYLSAPINTLNLEKDNYELLMSIYEQALNQTFKTLEDVKTALYKVYNHDVINSISKRIKTPESLINKMQKKHYEINFKNIIDNINDVAGLRIACPVKSDIYTVIGIIEQMPNIKIIERKDYITRPKKSGYSGYHLIIETPVTVNEQNVPVKVEIQIRTMAMDFWATNEHKVRYKTNKKLSNFDSKRLTAYAKIINILDDKIMEIYNKQELA